MFKWVTPMANLLIPIFTPIMKHIYITGTGSGIGKILAEALLEEPDTHVIGISRHQRIKHERYSHQKADLTKPSSFGRVKFKKHKNATLIALVNNAGTIGSIKPIGRIRDKDIEDTLHLNLAAPVILLNQFVKTYRKHPGLKVALNVSSGAAQRPIEGWATYCTTKAGLEMMARVLWEEQQALPEAERVHMFSVAPGVVDTPMQGVIRKSKPEDFPSHAQFVSLHEEGKLIDPTLVAARLKNIILNPGGPDGPVIQLEY